MSYLPKNEIISLYTLPIKWLEMNTQCFLKIVEIKLPYIENLCRREFVFSILD